MVVIKQAQVTIIMSDARFATQWRQAVSPPDGLVGRTRSLMRGAALTLGSAVNRTLDDRFLRCLYCHYVFDDQLRDFERLVVKLKAIGDFVDTKTCVEMVKGEKPITRRCFHLSFDDGFRNNLTNALPILEKHGVPAIFFVPSSLIQSCFEETRHYCLVKTKYRSTIEMLTWADLSQILSAGYDIGSHSKTHARFSDVSQSPTLLEEEILGSKHEIEHHLGQECRYISWPYGRLTDADQASLDVVRTAGYDACFGAFRGTVSAGLTDLFRIPRHHFEVQWPLAHVEYFARGNRESSR